MVDLTVGELAEAVGSDATDFDKAACARRIRGWAQLDLFPEAKASGPSRTSARLFSAEHIPVARAYNVLTSIGLAPSSLKQLSKSALSQKAIVDALLALSRERHVVGLHIFLNQAGAVIAARLAETPGEVPVDTAAQITIPASTLFGASGIAHRPM